MDKQNFKDSLRVIGVVAACTTFVFSFIFSCIIAAKKLEIWIESLEHPCGQIIYVPAEQER